MSTRLVLIASVLVLATHLTALVGAWQNRRRATTVEWTEHELPLVPMPRESTVVLLEVRWATSVADSAFPREPAWLDAGRLKTLGFDCSVAATHSRAREHYDAQLPRPVWVVLEHPSTATQRAVGGPAAAHELRLIDVGLIPGELRFRYPDTTRYALARGQVGVRWHRAGSNEATTRSSPRVAGWVNAPIPGQIPVPFPYSRQFLDFRAAAGDPRGKDQPPRYAVTLAWGARGEAWVKSARRLPP